MASRILAALLVALATCMAQDCPAQPSCGCAQQPTIIQMTCGNGGPSPPLVPPPPPPPPPPMHHTTAHYEQPTTAAWEDTTVYSGDISTLPRTDAEPCYVDNDLAIVIDSSASIGQMHYQIALEFAASLAQAWKQNPANGVSAFLFGSMAEKIFDLDQGRHMDANAVRNAIVNARYMEESTATDQGLQMAGNDLLLNGNPAVSKNIVLLTDGSSDYSPTTESVAQNLQNSGIHIVSVGIGSYLNDHELLVCAGGEQDRVFNPSQFDALLTYLKPVSEKACPPREP